MIAYKPYDLTPLLKKREFCVFVHGCNCQNAMGAGIAKTVRECIPEAFEADMRTKKGDRAKLGTIGIVPVKSTPYECSYVINAYTQFYYGRGVNADYEAIDACFEKIAAFMRDMSLTELTMPKIGAGLARGDWEKIEPLVVKHFPDITVNIHYKPMRPELRPGRLFS